MDVLTKSNLKNLSGPILITGHTGFKGTWLTMLLEVLGVEVAGLSLPPEKESLFTRARRTGRVYEEFVDIRDFKKVEKFVRSV